MRSKWFKKILRIHLAGVIIVAGGLLIYFSILKETPLFWRNAGGYSVEFRSGILHYFYFYLTTYLVFTAFLSLIYIRHFFVLLALWVLPAISMSIVAANNVENILSGRPLHYHPPLQDSN